MSATDKKKLSAYWTRFENYLSPKSNFRLLGYKLRTAKDMSLSALREIIMNGWPQKRSDCPAHLHAYWNYHDQVNVADGLILKGTSIVIPRSLQPDALHQQQYALQGSEKCKLRAKGSVF